MNALLLRPLLLCLLHGLVLSCPIARADVAVPANVLNPGTAPEAWNVIRLATANVEQLLKEQRLSEIPVQISLCSPSLRTLAQLADSAEKKVKLDQLTERALRSVNAIAQGGIDRNQVSTANAFSALQATLKEMAGNFDPKIVNADISVCPMHPDFVSANPAAPCAKCGMNLLARRIPYSFIYVPPGKPSIRMTVTTNGPLEAGRKAEVKVQLKRADDSPVLIPDLMVMHTQPIHLLIVDPSLEDYHHEHPVPTDVPGEYAFSFTPTKSSPYRMWADLVPALTGLQEYPVVDIPSTGAGGAIGNTTSTFTSTAGGLNFALTFFGGGGTQPRAGQVQNMRITVTDLEGKPVQRLEPVMEAFAHLVGFYDDYRTVVHLHPAGGDVTNPALRGGPSMAFKFYPPKAGFIRLYCQVLVGGRMIFAPFNVNVVE